MVEHEYSSAQIFINSKNQANSLSTLISELLLKLSPQVERGL